MTLTLHGPVPSKKNLLRVRRGGGLYRDGSVYAAIEALTTQAGMQWGHRTALEHPKMSVRFFVRSRRSDRDNRLTTILDCLQLAGVIQQDNIAHFNGEVTILPAILSKEKEMTVIEIKPQSQEACAS